MKLTLLLLLGLTAFATSVAAAMGKCPAWVPSFPLSVALLAQLLPDH